MTSPLPPGKIPSVLDNDCERPACGDMQQMLRQHQQQLLQPNVSTAAASAKTAAAKSSTSTISPTSSTSDKITTKNTLNSIEKTAATTATTNESNCPVDSSTLGRASWTLLHSMSAWYPDQPSIEDQDHMRNFFHSLARFYPCTYCATDFQQNLQKRPVAVQTRQELCTWLCEQHNIVNAKLGKKTFPCTMQQLDERWRKSSDPKCRG